MLAYAETDKEGFRQSYLERSRSSLINTEPNEEDILVKRNSLDILDDSNPLITTQEKLEETLADYRSRIVSHQVSSNPYVRESEYKSKDSTDTMIITAEEIALLRKSNHNST